MLEAWRRWFSYKRGSATVTGQVNLPARVMAGKQIQTFPFSLSFGLCCRRRFFPLQMIWSRKSLAGVMSSLHLLITDSVKLPTNHSNLYQGLEVMLVWPSNDSRQKLNQKKHHVPLPGEDFHIGYIYIWVSGRVESGWKLGHLGSNDNLDFQNNFWIFM